jgi:hypothetical protein
MFSKNHSQSAAKTERKEPTVLITEANDRKISDFGQEMTDEQRAAQKAELEKQMNAQARSLESAPQKLPLYDPQQAGSMQGTQPVPPPDPLVAHERELAYNSHFASNFAFSAEHGFLTMMQEHLALPFSANVLGVDVVVEKVDMTRGGHIVAICRRDGIRQRIGILDLPLPTPAPGGTE